MLAGNLTLATQVKENDGSILRIALDRLSGSLCVCYPLIITIPFTLLVWDFPMERSRLNVDSEIMPKRRSKASNKIAQPSHHIVAFVLVGIEPTTGLVNAHTRPFGERHRGDRANYAKGFTI